MADELTPPRSIKALRGLHEQDPQPMTQTEFTRASEHVPENAAKLREELVALGLISYRISRYHGNQKHLEITLTPQGRRVVELWLEIEKTVAEARLAPRPEKP